MNNLLTCISCNLLFLNIDDLKTHFKSDHHKYNLKRKIVNLPPITTNQFNELVLSSTYLSVFNNIFN